MFENDDVFDTGRTLLIDADSIVFAECCVFNEDSDHDRMRITRGIKRKVSELTLDAKCDTAICFLTTKTNFRDFLVDDYKANRDNKERPVNLAWAKRWTATNMESVYQDQLEADDLLGIYTDEDTVIWSIDKDLRQIPGRHLDDKTRKIYVVDEVGHIEERGSKVYFEGLAGLYYQMLIGDTTDWIVGCGKRVEAVYKSGKKAGETYIKRQGIGPKEAVKILVQAYVSGGGTPLENMKAAVIEEYKALHGADWQEHLETQANLLFMVREKHGTIIQRWTCDDREEYFDLVKGVILNDYTPPTVEDLGDS